MKCRGLTWECQASRNRLKTKLWRGMFFTMEAFEPLGIYDDLLLYYNDGASFKENKITNSPLTLTGAGHQWTVPINIGYIQWLSLATLTLKVAPAGRCHSLFAQTNKCGHAISGRNNNPCCLTHVEFISVLDELSFFPLKSSHTRVTSTFAHDIDFYRTTLLSHLFKPFVLKTCL